MNTLLTILFVLSITITSGKKSNSSSNKDKSDSSSGDVEIRSCSDQIECIAVDVTPILTGGNPKYEICLYWDDGLPNCDKHDGVSYGCSSNNKESDWMPGIQNALCETVDCSGTALFGIKDGKGCSGDERGTIPATSHHYDETAICTTAKVCNNKKECEWTLKAPSCDSLTTTPDPRFANMYIRDSETGKNINNKWHTGDDVEHKGSIVIDVPIVVGAIGAIVVLLCMIVIGLCCYRRQRNMVKHIGEVERLYAPLQEEDVIDDV